MGSSIAVTCIGRQPDSNVYVVGPKMQFNMNGEAIAEEDQTFVWVEEILTELGINPAEILNIPSTLDEHHSPISTLLETLQSVIGEGNVYSGIMVLGT